MAKPLHESGRVMVKGGWRWLWKLHEIIASIHCRWLAASSLAVTRLLPIQVIFNEEVAEGRGQGRKVEQNKSISNISKHLPSLPSASPAFAFAPPQLDSIKCAPPRYPPQLGRSIVPASPSIHVNHLGRLSERVELSSQLPALPVLDSRHSTLGYEINDFSANFQQFAFWPRPGTARPGQARQPHQQIESRRKLFD